MSPTVDSDKAATFVSDRHTSFCFSVEPNYYPLHLHGHLFTTHIDRELLSLNWANLKQLWAVCELFCAWNSIEATTNPTRSRMMSPAFTLYISFLMSLEYIQYSIRRLYVSVWAPSSLHTAIQGSPSRSLSAWRGAAELAVSPTVSPSQLEQWAVWMRWPALWLHFLQKELETHPGLQIKLSTIFEHCDISPGLIFLAFWLEGLAAFNAAIYQSVNFLAVVAFVLRSFFPFILFH